MKENKHIIEYDIAKGIGIICVVVGHCLPETDFIRTFIYTFHMPLFFVLSGLVTAKCSYTGIKEFLWNERKLVLNYCFWSMVYIVFDFFARFVIMHQREIKVVFSDIYKTVTLYGINVLWFLATLIFAKLLVRIIIEKYNNVYIILLIIFAFYYVTAYIWKMLVEFFPVVLTNNLIYYPLCAVFRAFEMSSFVLLGYVIKELFRKVLSDVNNLMNSIIMALMLFFNINLCKKAGNIDYHMMKIENIFVAFLLACTGTVAILGISNLLKKFLYVSNLLLWFGKRSLFIMVTHEYFLLEDLITYIMNKIIGFTITNVIGVKILFLVLLEVVLCLIIKPLIDHISDYILYMLSGWKENKNISNV